MTQKSSDDKLVETLLQNLDPSEKEQMNHCVVNKEILLNLIEQLQAETRELRSENQRLKDENNRLKGEQGKPDIKARVSRKS